jgi:hypothetical protein
MREDEFDDLMRVQRSMAGRLRQENEMDRKVKLMSLIQGMRADRRGRILLESIMVEASTEGFPDDETDRLLDSLQEDGFLKRVEDGVMMLL